MKKIILNLGCGTKFSDHPHIVNIDWSMYLRISRVPLVNRFLSLFLRGERKTKFINMPKNIKVHDLSKGIPFPDASVDIVYSSHFLEHIDRYSVPEFLKECLRVLKPGGHTRIVVPDMAYLCKRYLEHYNLCETGDGFAGEHDTYIKAMIEQCVRKESVGSSIQPWFRRKLENYLLGDARRRGETHQWMYDLHNLSALLGAAGFVDVKNVHFDTSELKGWSNYRLDLDESGNEYKKNSLYMEGKKQA